MPAPGNKPKNLLHTLHELMAYLGRHKRWPTSSAPI